MFFIYFIQHCFHCCPSDSTVSEDDGIEPRTVATLALAVRRSYHSARCHPPRLDLINSRLDLIHCRLDLIHTRLDLIHTRLDLIHTRLDLINTRLHCPNTTERKFNLGVLNLYKTHFIDLFNVKITYSI